MQSTRYFSKKIDFSKFFQNTPKSIPHHATTSPFKIYTFPTTLKFRTRISGISSCPHDVITILTLHTKFQTSICNHNRDSPQSTQAPPLFLTTIFRPIMTSSTPTPNFIPLPFRTPDLHLHYTLPWWRHTTTTTMMTSHFLFIYFNHFFNHLHPLQPLPPHPKQSIFTLPPTPSNQFFFQKHPKTYED